MIQIPELWILLLAIIAALLLYKLLKTVKKMIINIVVGLVILVVGNIALGLGMAYSWIVILICAFSGAFGAILIILLKYLGIAF
ncbi:MAG: pro-sigmaK processing inhibitor BofA family protein [Methanosarcinaceae archaeon]|nr:pro-sigmaK processing inhibitor BofA family protein [Methanosarcinaceae archaeon]